MKKITKVSFLLLVLIIVASTACGNKSKTDAAATDQTVSPTQAQKDKRFPFERGSYQEVTNVMGMDMKKTIYFEHWGDWTASEEKMELELTKNFTQKTHKLNIVKGNEHWDLDMIQKTGTTYQREVPVNGMEAAVGAALGGKMMEGTEIKELGEENYLGYNCKKTEIKYPKMDMDITILTYGNLNMKMEGKMGKMEISTIVTSIDLTAPPDSIFEVPNDIKITKLNM